MLTSLHSKGERNLERYVSEKVKINMEGSLWWRFLSLRSGFFFFSFFSWWTHTWAFHYSLITSFSKALCQAIPASQEHWKCKKWELSFSLFLPSSIYDVTRHRRDWEWEKGRGGHGLCDYWLAKESSTGSCTGKPSWSWFSKWRALWVVVFIARLLFSAPLSEFIMPLPRRVLKKISVCKRWNTLQNEDCSSRWNKQLF